MVAIVNHLEEYIKCNNEFVCTYFKLAQFQIELEINNRKISFGLFLCFILN